MVGECEMYMEERGVSEEMRKIDKTRYDEVWCTRYIAARSDRYPMRQIMATGRRTRLAKKKLCEYMETP